jgi:PAS domain S-box-containing protein
MMNEQPSKASPAPRFPLSLLLVEDNPADAELCLEFLDRAQFDIRSDVVTTAKEFVDRTSTTDYDIIVADYNLGCWTGMDALDLLNQQGRDIPFILLTAALGDQTAVECMQRGIADYVLKNRMDLLPVAIYRALEQKALRNERRQSARSLEESDAKFRALAEAIPTAVFVEQGTRCRYVNRAAEILTGYSREELLAKTFCQLLPEGLRKALAEQFHAELNTLDADESQTAFEARILTKRGEWRSLSVTVGIFQVDGRLAALISAVETSARAQFEKGAYELSEEHTSAEALDGCALRGVVQTAPNCVCAR